MKKWNSIWVYTSGKSCHTDADNYRIPRILVSNDAFETLIKEWDGFDEEK